MMGVARSANPPELHAITIVCFFRTIEMNELCVILLLRTSINEIVFNSGALLTKGVLQGFF